MVRIHLDLIDQHTLAIDELTERIEVVMHPFRSARDLIVTIPGISTTRRRRDHRRDRRGHEPVPDGRAPGLVGRDVPGLQRVRRTGEVDPHPSRQSLPEGRSRRRGAVGFAHARTPTSPPSTGASPHVEDRSRPSSPSNTPCSSPSGTCSAPAPSTPIPAATSSPRRNPDKAKNRALDQLRQMGYVVSLEPISAAG